MKYSLLEVVKLQQDLPGSNLQKGDIGARLTKSTKTNAQTGNEIC